MYINYKVSSVSLIFHQNNNFFKYFIVKKYLATSLLHWFFKATKLSFKILIAFVIQFFFLGTTLSLKTYFYFLFLLLWQKEIRVEEVKENKSEPIHIFLTSPCIVPHLATLDRKMSIINHISSKTKYFWQESQHP